MTTEISRPSWAEDDLRGYIAQLERELAVTRESLEIRTSALQMKIDTIGELRKELAETRQHLQNALDRAQRLMDEREGKVSA